MKKDESVICVIMGYRGKLSILKDPESGRFYEGDSALAFIEDIDIKKHLKRFRKDNLRRV
jgi:hypothetical protein